MLITVGQLLTGDYDKPVDGGAVLIDDASGRVVAAGPRGTLASQAAPGDRHLDYPGATAMPGLINGHVHLCFDQAADPVALAEAEPAELLPVMLERAGQLLRHGATTVRDLGDRRGAVLRLREHLSTNHPTRAAPRLLAAGAPMTPPGGHCWFLGGEVEGSLDALTAHVDALADAGVDWIKVMVSGGRITEGGAEMWESQFDLDQLQAIVGAAARRRLPVAAHAHGASAVADSAAAGVATIEHCTMLGSPQLDVAFDPNLPAAMRNHGVAVCHADSHDVDHFSQQVGRDTAVLLIGRIRWLADHGVTVFTGTDAGVMTDFAGTVPAMLEHSPQFSPAEILRMATTDAARALRIDHTVGRLEPGYSADVLIVDGDPLQDVSALDRVDAVVARGRLVS